MCLCQSMKGRGGGDSTRGLTNTVSGGHFLPLALEELSNIRSRRGGGGCGLLYCAVARRSIGSIGGRRLSSSSEVLLAVVDQNSIRFADAAAVAIQHRTCLTNSIAVLLEITTTVGGNAVCDTVCSSSSTLLDPAVLLRPLQVGVLSLEVLHLVVDHVPEAGEVLHQDRLLAPFRLAVLNQAAKLPEALVDEEIRLADGETNSADYCRGG